MIVFLYLGIMFFSGMGALLITAFFLGALNQRKRCRKKVNANVLQIIRAGQRDDNNIKKRMKRGICEFEHAGIMYETKYMNFIGADSGIKEGDSIEIYINVNKPTEAVLKNKKSNMFFGGYIVGIVGCIGLILLSMFQWEYTTQGEYSQKKYEREQAKEREKAREEYIKEHPLYQLVTPAPIEYKMVDVNYFNIIKSVPSNFTKPIYYGNNPKMGGCEFYDKNMHEIICIVETGKYTDKKERLEFIDKRIFEDGENLYEGTILYEYPIKEIEKKKINGIEYVIQRKSCEDSDARFKYYRYYAYWFTDNEYAFIIHKTSKEQLKKIVVNSLKNREK